MATTGPWDDDIARAITPRPDVLRQALRDAKHYANKYRQTTWPTSAPTAPVAVYLTRDNRYYALAFDIDAPGPEGARQAHAIAATLTAAGTRFVEAESGPSGRRHIICTWIAGLEPRSVAKIARRLQDVAPDLDAGPLLNPITGCIRPPGAVHRTGGASRLITPRDQALRTLQEGNEPEAFARLQDALGITPEPDTLDAPRVKTWAALTHLPHVGGVAKLTRPYRDLTTAERTRMTTGGSEPGADRSKAAARATLVAAQAGWSFPQFLTLVHNPRLAAFDHLRRRNVNGTIAPRHNIDAAAQRMWNRRLLYVLNHPARGTTPLVLEVERCARTAAATPWKGQGGPRERATLEALVTLARHTGNATVSKDIRSLANQTGASRSATATALQRLQRNGWIRLVTPAAGQRAATYRLTVPATGEPRGRSSAGWTLAPTPPSTASGQRAPAPPFTLGFTHRAHDALTSEGLGHHAGLLLDLLVSEPLAIEDITDRTGWDRRTIRKHLARLAAHALVLPGMEWTVLPGRLDTAARSLRTTGTIRRRQEQAALDRQTWAWWLADFRAERGWATRRGLRTPGYRTTKTGTPCPAMPFPLAANGRRDWRAASSLAAEGLGPTPDDLDALAAAATLSERRPVSPTVTRPYGDHLTLPPGS